MLHCTKQYDVQTIWNVAILLCFSICKYILQKKFGFVLSTYRGGRLSWGFLHTHANTHRLLDDWLQCTLHCSHMQLSDMHLYNFLDDKFLDLNSHYCAHTEAVLELKERKMHERFRSKKAAAIFALEKVRGSIGWWIPWVHLPPLSMTDPSGQTHAIERVGWESTTTHFWSNWHGLFTLHGFWQVWEMHASFEGQSWSILHSGSSDKTAKAKKWKQPFSKKLNFLSMVLSIIQNQIILRSAQATNPSPFSGGLQVHSSWWLIALQVAPRTHLGSVHRGIHSFLWAPLG